MDKYRRSAATLGVTFVLYALLVTTNLGEFWPFSIYPMFSRGGIPWSRAVVREVPEDVQRIEWTSYEADALPGRPYPLLEYGVDPIDLSNFVSKTKVWDEPRVRGLRRMFGQHELDHRNLLVVRVNGRIIDGDSVSVSFIPYALMSADSSALNPDLPQSTTE